MKKFLAAFFNLFRVHTKPEGVYVGRAATRDVAIQFRMAAGFPGDVNRTHPASIEPCLIDVNAPPSAFGQPVVVDPTTQGVRGLVAGDSTLTDVYGFTVRPYPFQQQDGTNYGAVAFGVGAPAANQVIDVLRSGYIMAKLSGAAAAYKGEPVNIWFAISAGLHVQGGIEAVATGGSTFPLNSRTTFNGPADASGIVEIAFNQ